MRPELNSTVHCAMISALREIVLTKKSFGKYLPFEISLEFDYRCVLVYLNTIA